MPRLCGCVFIPARSCQELSPLEPVALCWEPCYGSAYFPDCGRQFGRAEGSADAATEFATKASGSIRSVNGLSNILFPRGILAFPRGKSALMPYV